MRLRISSRKRLIASMGLALLSTACLVTYSSACVGSYVIGYGAFASYYQPVPVAYVVPVIYTAPLVQPVVQDQSYSSHAPLAVSAYAPVGYGGGVAASYPIALTGPVQSYSGVSYNYGGYNVGNAFLGNSYGIGATFSPIGANAIARTNAVVSSVGNNRRTFNPSGIPIGASQSNNGPTMNTVGR